MWVPTFGQLLRKSKAPKETHKNVTPSKRVKSDGKATETKLYRGKNALEEFLKALLREEDRIKEELRKGVSIKIGQNDWEDCTSPFSGAHS